jgi:hypothetical protein
MFCSGIVKLPFRNLASEKAVCRGGHNPDCQTSPGYKKTARQLFAGSGLSFSKTWLERSRQESLLHDHLIDFANVAQSFQQVKGSRLQKDSRGLN